MANCAGKSKKLKTTQRGREASGQGEGSGIVKSVWKRPVRTQEPATWNVRIKTQGQALYICNPPASAPGVLGLQMCVITRSGERRWFRKEHIDSRVAVTGILKILIWWHYGGGRGQEIQGERKKPPWKPSRKLWLKNLWELISYKLCSLVTT